MHSHTRYHAWLGLAGEPRHRCGVAIPSVAYRGVAASRVSGEGGGFGPARELGSALTGVERSA